MKTLVVTPTYNERENLETLVASLPDVSLLIVDDASPDGTGELADMLAAAHPDCVHVLHREKKLGLGSAYLAGFRYGIDHGFEAICEMDADGSHDPSALQLLMNAARDADVAIGSRRVRGGKIIGWGAHRHLMSHGAMFFARYVLGLRTRDVTSGFRLYRASAVRALLAQNIQSNGYAFQEETLFYCEKLGFRVCEVPVTFTDRIHGRSKLSWKEIIEFFVTIERLRKSK